ncbi:MAG: ABC transporter substrate-binding protein [Bacteroidales bacterium]|nr:ABC transporter substrate-binding protein [Bacteroidales bacterium]
MMYFGTLFVAFNTKELMIAFRVLQLTVLATFFSGMIACSGNRQPSVAIGDADTVAVHHAQGFAIVKSGHVTLLTVFNPWQGAQHVAYRYALCPKDMPVPKNLDGYTVIRTPVERVICMSTTHVAMLSALEKTSVIKALSGAAYVSDETVRSALADGSIADVGYDVSLDFEKIVTLHPDVIFAYGVGQEVIGTLSRLSNLGLTVVINAEYLEKTALGKAEWLRFMAAFCDVDTQADSLFRAIRQEYDSLKTLAARCTEKPTVMCGLPWQGLWYIPGGKTTIASLIADAGGDFLWKDNDSHESYPVNIEAIMEKGAIADLWLNTGAARSLAEIKSVDERLAFARPWQTGQVFNNYARMGAGGGNDFFESGTVYPQKALKDLIKIFHPEILPHHSLYYYMQLN